MNCAKDLEDSLRLVPIHTPCDSQPSTQPTPTELALIAAMVLDRSKSVNISTNIDDALRYAYTLWQEARRVLQEQQTTTPDRARL